jgi:hypothetical protein
VIWAVIEGLLVFVVLPMVFRRELRAHRAAIANARAVREMLQS